MSSRKVIAAVIGLMCVVSAGCEPNGSSTRALPEFAMIVVLGEGTDTQPIQVVDVLNRDGTNDGATFTMLPAEAGPIQTISIAPYDPNKGPPGHGHDGGPSHPGAHCHYYVSYIPGQWEQRHC